MKKAKCQNCGLETTGTESRKFCSTSCRVNHWQKNQRAKKVKRPAFKKLEKETVEQAQLRVFASMITLKDAALAGDNLAIKVLGEVDKLLNGIAGELSNGN